jgi:hypothetical protein
VRSLHCRRELSLPTRAFSGSSTTALLGRVVLFVP